MYLREEKQKRYKSKVVWVSVVSLILLIFNQIEIYEKIGIQESILKNIFDAILTILVSFGILNNPTEKGEF